MNNIKTLINWQIFFILISLSLLSILAVFPYVLTLQGELLIQTGIPIIVIFLMQLVQSALLFSVAIFVGLYLAPKIGFHLPILEAIVRHKDYQKVVKDVLPLSMILGCITAVTIYFTDQIFTLLGAAISTSQGLAPIWQKILASFYGGITEEILMRLFIMTLLIFIGMKTTRKRQPSHLIIVLSIMLAAVIFGLGHLPITASLTTLTPLIIYRAIFLNGAGGVVFGWLYWKKGLESAMIAHFTTDIFLLTVLPLVF